MQVSLAWGRSQSLGSPVTCLPPCQCQHSRTSEKLAISAARGKTLAQTPPPTTKAAQRWQRGDTWHLSRNLCGQMTNAFLGLWDNSAMLRTWDLGTASNGKPQEWQGEFLTSSLEWGTELKLTIELKVENWEYYLVIRRNEVLIQATPWMKL